METLAPNPQFEVGSSKLEVRSSVLDPLCALRVSAVNSPWLIARDIARATGHQKKQIHRLATREKWPSRQHRNRLEYQPPPHIAEIVLQTPLSPDCAEPRAPRVKFADLHHSDTQREITLWREETVRLYQNNGHLGIETALQLVCNSMKQKYPLFNVSPSSIRRWTHAYKAHGLDGLVEQKRGAVGQKPFARDLDQSDILRLTAHAVEYGSAPKGKASGRTNIARAYRDLVSDPTVNGPARQWLHGEAASKSYVPPSVRAAVQASVSPLATTLIQIGPKAAKLDGPYTECSYENLPAGRAWTADDMTANVYVWCEFPNERGFLIGRPQILALADISAMLWQCFRGVMRPKGQYCKDDVWGLIGDKMDQYGVHVGPDGKPDEIAVLEGGTWQSNVVIGTKTSVDDETRFGGLRALGVKVIHTRTPRGKIIETMFNSLQHAADNCRGYCGRDERKDCPESVKRQLYEVNQGQAHPSKYFMNLFEYNEHLQNVMRNLNTERNDGKILRGMCPVDKWAQDTAPRRVPSPRGEGQGEGELVPVFKAFPDTSKWMYRSSYRVIGVTRNGVRITVGSGKHMVAYTYNNPEKLEPFRNRGRVLVWWNDSDPDTDAVVYTVKSGRPDKFICVAPRVNTLDRFGASAEEMEREGARKKLAHNLAVTQGKSLAPYLQRSAVQGSRFEVQGSTVPDSSVPTQLAQARAANDAKKQSAAKIHRAIKAVEITPEDLRAATECEAFTAPESDEGGPAPDDQSYSSYNSPRSPESYSEPSSPEMTAAEINALLSDDPDPSPMILPSHDSAKKDYVLHPAPGESPTDQRHYLDYLLQRLTDFRAAGSSFGQKFTGQITIHITRKITQGQLKGKLYAQDTFDQAVAHLQSKIDATILGKRNTAQGKPNYHDFATHAL